MGRRKKSLKSFYFSISVCAAFPWLQSSDLRPALPAKLNMVLVPKMKEFIFHMAPKEEINAFYSALGDLCSAQVGFAAQKLHICVLF